MLTILSLWVLAQTLGVQAYITADMSLALDNGRYAIELGSGCDDVGPSMNVLFLAGSRNVGAIQPVGTDILCNVYIAEWLSDEPCAMNEDGACDVNAE